MTSHPPDCSPTTPRSDAVEVLYSPGTRVRLTNVDPTLTLRSDVGTILGPAEWGGYYIVRLDEPAVFDDRVNEPEEITDIVQDEEELEISPPETSGAAGGDEP